MAQHHDRLIDAATLRPKPPAVRTERMTRPEIVNLIRATVLPGGHRISEDAVGRIADAWVADAELTHRLAYDSGYDDAAEDN